MFKGTDGACADPGTQNFPCHGVHSPAFQFYSSSFYVTHRFFVTFFTEESNVLFVFLLVLYAMLTLSLPPPST